MANEIIFNPKVNEQGKIISDSIDPFLALDYLRDFSTSGSDCLTYRPPGHPPAQPPIPIHGFYFDIPDIYEVIKNLLNSTTGKYEFYLGVGINATGDHTLIAGAVELIFDNEGNEIQRKLIHNATNHPIYDYCNPCPPRCPTEVKIIPNQD